MIDTIKFTYNTAEPEHKKNIDLAKDLIQIKGQSIYGGYYGYYKNLRVGITSFSITVEGSLSRYLSKDNTNFHTLSRSEIESIVNELSNYFNLPLSQSVVKRLDIAKDISLNFKPSLYFKSLCRLKGFNRLENESNIIYRKSNIEIEFYDKYKQMKAKKRAIDDLFKNTLRIELRIKGGLKKVFKKEVLLQDIYNESFYKKMGALWLHYYQSIEKAKDFNLSTTATTVSSQKELALNHYIHTVGINKYFDDLQYNYEIGITTKKEYYDLKKASENVLKDDFATKPNELTMELNSKASRAISYFR